MSINVNREGRGARSNFRFYSFPGLYPVSSNTLKKRSPDVDGFRVPVELAKNAIFANSKITLSGSWDFASKIRADVSWPD